MDMSDTTETILRFDQVTKVFGGKAILNGMDFRIARGETFVIVGPSGTGKSVTLKHMVRLLTPDSGDIYVGDSCINQATGRELETLRERFGYLFQGGGIAGLADRWRECCITFARKNEAYGKRNSGPRG